MSRQGIITSLILHLIIFWAVFFGLPSFLDDRVTQNQVITLEMLPISEFSNVKSKKIAKKQEEQKKLTQEIPKPSMAEPEVATADLEPLPKPKEVKENKKYAESLPKDLIKDKPKKEEKKTKEEEQKPKPKEKKKTEDGFDSVLKTIEDFSDAKEKDDKKQEEESDFADVEDMLSKSDDNIYNEHLPMSISEVDAIKQQIMRHYTIISGAKDAGNNVVILILKIAEDGTVTDIDFDNKSRYVADNFYRAAVDAAIRAAKKASPLQGLPPDKYGGSNGWQELEVRFDTSEMFY